MPLNVFQKALVITASAVALPVDIPLVVGGLGFGTAGIAAGSWAASFMASYGGAVTAGSACATLQSIGAVGLSTCATALAATVGGTTAGMIVNGGKDDGGPTPPPPEGPPTDDGGNGNDGGDEDDEEGGDDGGNDGKVTEKPRNGMDDTYIKEISDMFKPKDGMM